MTWDPSQYLKFDDLRTRPALDLLARIPEIDPATIWDLGCGTGTITSMLADRWPRASTFGLDNSASMLERVPNGTSVTWINGTIEEWTPPTPPDLVFSNAALHWVKHHEILFPRLFNTLTSDGVVAVQMPHNHAEPSHRALYELAASPMWSDQVADLIIESPVAAPEHYHGMLSPITTTLDVWETVYQQPLDGDDAVANWTKGSAMRPYLERLGDDGERFFAAYAEILREHYPRRADGTTLFAFRRLFIVARR
jgi:trans-aconitate 2-methyltransferase